MVKTLEANTGKYSAYTQSEDGADQHPNLTRTPLPAVTLTNGVKT